MKFDQVRNEWYTASTSPASDAVAIRNCWNYCKRYELHEHRKVGLILSMAKEHLHGLTSQVVRTSIPGKS